MISTKFLFLFKKKYYVLTKTEICRLLQTVVELKKFMCGLVQVHVGTASAPDHIKPW